MNDDLIPPEVVFCGFSRIAPVPRQQQHQRALTIAASQEVLLTISVLDDNRYTFSASIHKQADIQTLARTIEVLLAERGTLVACLIDLGSDNVLRWSDTVNDVLDAESVVGVKPLSQATLVRNKLNTTGSPTQESTSETKDPDAHQSRTTPLPQLEFLQRPPLVPRSSSFGGPASAATLDSFYIDTALVRKRSDMQHHKPTLKALRITRPSIPPGSLGQIPAVEPYANSYLPPLPMSPIPKAVQSNLVKLCSNSILLLAFCRYCVRKRTLCELLYWLDTSTEAEDEDYIHRVYLATDAPLKLNLPREVSTIIEAREILHDGILTWSEQGFEQSEEGLRARAVQSERPAFFRTAAIVLNGSTHPSRKSFTDLLGLALDPEDTSILSLKERRSDSTRQAILEQVCGQYFSNKQVDTSGYFEVNLLQLTKPERLRLSNRRQIYGGLFDKHSAASLVKQSSTNRSGLALVPRTLPRSESYKLFGNLDSRSGAQIQDLMPMEDHSIKGWSEVSPPQKSSYRDSTTLGAAAAWPIEDIVQKTNRTPGEIGKSPSVRSITTLGTLRSPHSKSASSSSMISDDTRATPTLTLTETQRADLVKRQTKLRSMLGAAPREVLDRQTGHMTTGLRTSSPSPSVTSKMSNTSNFSRLSLTRSEKDEEAERRTQVRRAAKLYAMFGEHADSSVSNPGSRYSNRGRNTASESFGRPESSASQYSPASMRSPSRNSTSAQSMFESSALRASVQSTPESRYQPDRDGGRRTFKSMMFGTPKDTRLSKEVLSTFPSPPMNRSPQSPIFNRGSQSPAFRQSFRSSGFHGSSLYGDNESIMEALESDDEDDAEGDAIVQDVRTNMKLRQLLGNDAPTSTIIN